MRGNLRGEVASDLRERPEGIGVRTRLNAMQLRCLPAKRVPSCGWKRSINDTRGFRVFRAKEGQTGGPEDAAILRKGVADMRRQAEVSQAANDRYLETPGRCGAQDAAGTAGAGPVPSGLLEGAARVHQPTVGRRRPSAGDHIKPGRVFHQQVPE